VVACRRGSSAIRWSILKYFGFIPDHYSRLNMQGHAAKLGQADSGDGVKSVLDSSLEELLYHCGPPKRSHLAFPTPPFFS